MTLWILAFFILPIPFLFFCCWVSEEVCGAGASIPGALIGLTVLIVSWGVDIGLIIS